MKTCFKCGITKPIDAFYTHSMMADGHLGKCIVCARNDSTARRKENLKDPAWIASERARQRTKMKTYRALGLSKQPSKEAKAKWESNNKWKRRAQSAACHAQRSGLLVKPDRCERCNEPEVNLVKHHPDYNYPITVQWLCESCHGFVHRKP